MWYKRFEYVNIEKGLSIDTIFDCLYSPLIEEELTKFGIDKYYPEFVNMRIPKEITLPTEYLQLLHYSNGGLIVNKNREFSYFSLSEIRNFYFGYGFPKWAPLFLPIAFNGGGIFYAYDFRDLFNVNIVAVSSSDLDYESSVILGKTIREVLNKTTNIEDDLSNIFQKPELSDIEKRRIELLKKLSNIKADREKGLINLKTYLLKKRELENEINLFKA